MKQLKICFFLSSQPVPHTDRQVSGKVPLKINERMCRFGGRRACKTVCFNLPHTTHTYGICILKNLRKNIAFTCTGEIFCFASAFPFQITNTRQRLPKIASAMTTAMWSTTKANSALIVASPRAQKDRFSSIRLFADRKLSKIQSFYYDEWRSFMK